MAALYAGLGALAVAWGALRGHPNVLLLPDAAHAPARVAFGLLGGLAFGLLVALSTPWLGRRFAWARLLHREFRALLCPLTTGEMFAIAASSALGEELFFRGALLPHVGLWAQAALFALLHIGPGARFLPWTLFSFIVGLVMGALLLHSGDLGGPIVAHFTINLLNLRHLATHDVP